MLILAACGVPVQLGVAPSKQVLKSKCGALGLGGVIP